MHLPAIPDQNQLAAQLTVQLLDKLHHVVGDNVVIVQTWKYTPIRKAQGPGSTRRSRSSGRGGPTRNGSVFGHAAPKCAVARAAA